MADFIKGTELLLLYFIVMAGSAILCRILIRIPDELFRKILHCILLFSLPVFVFGYQSWQTAALLAVLFRPGTAFSHYLDLIGTAVVAVYLALCGLRTIRERI